MSSTQKMPKAKNWTTSCPLYQQLLRCRDKIVAQQSWKKNESFEVGAKIGTRNWRTTVQKWNCIDYCWSRFPAENLMPLDPKALERKCTGHEWGATKYLKPPDKMNYDWKWIDTLQLSRVLDEQRKEVKPKSILKDSQSTKRNNVDDAFPKTTRFFSLVKIFRD